MTLNIKRTGSEDYGRWIKILNCGEPGSGKTKTAATWPDPLYVNAEGGLMSVADQNLPTIDVSSSGMLLELRDALAQPPKVREKALGTPVQTVIIDTIDEVARILIKERLDGTSKDAMAIQDWGWLGEQLRAMVRSYRNLPLHVVLNCHLKSVTDEETGRMFVKPAIQGAMGDEIAGYVDLAVVLTARPVTEVVNGRNVRKIVRVMQTFPDSRQPWIKDRSGKLPMEFQINFDDDYKRLDELIFGGRPVAEAIQETVVQPGQEEGVVEAAEEVVKAAAPPVAAPPEKKKAATTRAKKAEVPAPEPVATVVEPKVPVEPEIEPPAPAEVLPDPEPEPSTAAEVEESVPAPETAPSAAPALVCADCSGEIKTKDQADLSFIRFRRRLCKDCFKTARTRK